MPFSKIFDGELVYNIEYDEIDPNNLFDEVAMADILEEVPVVDDIFIESKSSTNCNDEQNINDDSTKKRKRKRKEKDTNEPDPNAVNLMNELASILNRGDLNALKLFIEKHFDTNCYFLTSTITDSVCGREYIYNFFESGILLHPEQVVEFQNYTKECEYSMYFTLSYEGTYYDPENKSILTHGDDKSNFIDTSLWQNDHVSGRKYAQDEESNRNKHVNLLQKHKPVEVVARGCSRIFYEYNNDIIVISDFQMKWRIKKVEESSIIL